MRLAREMFHGTSNWSHGNTPAASASFVCLLYVPSYNKGDPALFGFPFFYWYQLLWVPITVLLIWFVYRMTHHED